jgi:Kef-type K+ transport system membrane component KefB
MEPRAIVTHGDPIAPVILGVTSILLFAIIGRVVARRLGQPTVLGELLMGILLGNLAYYFGIDLITVLREGQSVFDVVNRTLAGAPVAEVAAEIFGVEKGAEIVRIVTGPHGGEVMQVAHTVDVFSRYGVIFLLFMVGLENELRDLQQVGKDAVRVAIIGVVVPFLLGMAATVLLRPDMSMSTIMFIAATLGATSVGISAQVLHEVDQHRSRTGRIVLGAAVADDILGLMMLAIVSGIVVSGSVDLREVIIIITISALFLGSAIALGPYIVRFSAHIMRRLDLVEAKMFTSYLFVMVLAWVANLAGLATIVGAFAAGLILSDQHFKDYEDESGQSRRQLTIRELIMPLEVILVPIFFILMGIQVKLESFLHWSVIVLAAGLLVAAIVGKLVSGIGAARPINRLAVGIGMLPRGEVGLVFAAIGRTLGVLNDAVFSAIVLMVVVTTLIAPPWLKHELLRQPPEADARPG